MGWYLQSVSAELSPFDTGELYGDNVKVTFLLSYKAEMSKKFVESPKLNWHEKIIMVDYAKSQRWVFETNMYEHNPLSNTLKIWPMRYIEAYDFAQRHGPNPGIKGFSKLLDDHQQPVPVAKLGNAMTPAQKADAVRNYLAANGGYLDIQIHDIPSINKPRGQATGTPDHKERLLLFDVGVVGGGNRRSLAQLLNVDHALPAVQWTRRCEQAWFQTDLPLPAGFANVAAPTSVSAPRAPVTMAGEYI